MEVARLFDQNVFITQEWFIQSNAGIPQENIIRTLEEKYRIHSQKKIFECLCCGQTVSLVLRADSPHFRHQGVPCAGGTNYNTYNKSIKSGDDGLKHRAGRAILRTYLEGQLRQHHVEVQEGYMCKTLLKVVPDFLLMFQDGSVWSVDYITGIRQDESYNSFIKKRTTTYTAAGFKPFFFIDSSWLAKVPERSLVSLYLAESQMKIKSSMDQTWTEFIQEFVEAFGEDFLLRHWFEVNKSHNVKVWEVYSLLYVDPNAGEAIIQRFIPAQTKVGLHVYRSTITLEQATSLNETGNEFRWWEESETERMTDRLQELTMQYEREQELLTEREQDRQQQMLLMEKELEKTVNTSNVGKSLGQVSHSKKMTDGNGDELLKEIHIHEYSTIVNAIHTEMSVPDSMLLHQIIKDNKSRLSNDAKRAIRQQARLVMGPINKPNKITKELRDVLIEIALI
jgi:hypothetical protein